MHQLFWLNLFFQWVSGFTKAKVQTDTGVKILGGGGGTLIINMVIIVWKTIINHLSGFCLTLCLLNDVSACVWELSHVCVSMCKLVSQSLWIIGIICESETAVVLFWLIICNPVEVRRLSVTLLNLLLLSSRCHVCTANTRMSGKLIQISPLQPGNAAVDCRRESKQWVKYLLPSWRHCQQRFCSFLSYALYRHKHVRETWKLKGRWISRVGAVTDRQVKKWIATPCTDCHFHVLGSCVSLKKKKKTQEIRVWGFKEYFKLIIIILCTLLTSSLSCCSAFFAVASWLGWSLEIFACSVLQLLCVGNKKMEIGIQQTHLSLKRGKMCHVFFGWVCLVCEAGLSRECHCNIWYCHYVFWSYHATKAWKMIERRKAMPKVSSLNVKRRGVKHLNGLRIPMWGVGFTRRLSCHPPSLSLPTLTLMCEELVLCVSSG